MFKNLIGIIILMLTLSQPLFAEDAVQTSSKISFQIMDLWIDSGDIALAAYQVELTFDHNIIKIVGLEGGTASSYTNAPYYDQKGFDSGRLIVAAFTTSKDAPQGRTLVARIHIAVEGNTKPELSCKLMTAARTGGERISPKVELTTALLNKQTTDKEEK